jgi:hypothetical protein
MSQCKWLCRAGVAEVADSEAGIVICCNLGGTLTPKDETSVGIQSRSLVAAYELVNAGYGHVKVLDEGVNGWKQTGRDVWILSADGHDTEGNQGTFT